VSDACFYSGLKKIISTKNGIVQMAWRPRKVFFIIQSNYLKPDFLFDVSPFWPAKIQAINAYKSQFYNPESQEDEKKLTVSRNKAANNVEERLVNAYNRIRGNAENGLAVVMVRRGACGGCFNIVPPQRQADIKDKKKIIVCEHCGRILADVDAVEIVRR
jgi:hypothetical protein